MNNIKLQQNKTMQNFSVLALASAMLSATALAQLPRPCFLMTEMHGQKPSEGKLVSNLPWLQAQYKPGMYLRSITSLKDSKNNGKLIGVQAELTIDGHELVELPVVGMQVGEENFWELQEVNIEEAPIDRISILSNSDQSGGVCNLEIYQDDMTVSLADKAIRCSKEEEGIEQTELLLVGETPLVGFRGWTDGKVLNSLGFIFLNLMDKDCHAVLTDDLIESFEGQSIFEQSQKAESAITEQEKIKADTLEAILAYNRIQEARKSIDKVHDEILELLNNLPIDEVFETPSEVKKMLESLSEFDVEDNFDEDRVYI